MTPLWKKLNLVLPARCAVLRAPTSFARAAAELAAICGDEATTQLDATGPFEFVLAFAMAESEVTEIAAFATRATFDDAVVWVAYPKASSKRYTCSFNRDTGFNALGSAGFEPVRQVAIDEDWSTLRFRRVAFIRRMTRATERALSDAGRARTRNGNA